MRQDIRLFQGCRCLGKHSNGDGMCNLAFCMGHTSDFAIPSTVRRDKLARRPRDESNTHNHMLSSGLRAPRYHAIKLGLGPFGAFRSPARLRSFARWLFVNLIADISMFTIVVLVVVESPHPLLGP